MKLVKSASGKNKIKMSRAEWTNLGKKAGWGERPPFHRRREEIGEAMKDILRQLSDPDLLTRALREATDPEIKKS